MTIGWRLGGGVEITERSRDPISENWSVRGIGVAVSVSVSTLTLIWRSFSLAATPNFCSSSMTRSPSDLKRTFFPNILWVPIRMSIFPSSSSFSTWAVSFALLERLRCSIRTGKSRSRSLKER